MSKADEKLDEAAGPGRPEVVAALQRFRADDSADACWKRDLSDEQIEEIADACMAALGRPA